MRGGPCRAPMLTAGAVMTVLYIAGTFSVLLAMPKEQVSGLAGHHAGDSSDDVEAGHCRGWCRSSRRSSR